MFATCLPVTRFGSEEHAPSPRYFRALPLAGAVVGAIGGAAFLAATWLTLPMVVAAVLCVIAQVLATGALHEDALADTADGFGGGTSRERTLEIMRDSALGSYGATALILSLGLRISAIWSIASITGSTAAVIGALIGAGALSRAAAVALISRLPPARADGLSATTGQVSAAIARDAGLAGAIVVVLAVWSTASIAAVVLAVAALAGGTIYMMRLARRRLEGQTGDVAGATQQVCEGLFLIGLLVAI